MKPIRLLARIIGVAAMAVAVGTAVNQILNGGRWNWWALAAALTLATLAEGVNRWLVRSDVHDEQIRPTTGLVRCCGWMG
jgi:bacteriorhodopsin